MVVAAPRSGKVQTVAPQDLLFAMTSYAECTVIALNVEVGLCDMDCSLNDLLDFILLYHYFDMLELLGKYL